MCSPGCECGRHGKSASLRAAARNRTRVVSDETRRKMSKTHQLRHAEDPEMTSRSTTAMWEARVAKGFKNESSAVRSKKWRGEHDEKVKADRNAYRKTSRGRETMDLASARRRQKTSLQISGNEYVDRVVVFDRDNGACGICSEQVNPFMYHIDHIIPISKGGSHNYANVQLAHPKCNWEKNDRAR